VDKGRRVILFGGVLLLLLGLASAAVLLRPAQARSGLAEAQARWEAGGPASYRLRLTQQTNLGACDQEMLAEAGKATPVRNSCGQPATWTVPRLFGWIAELERDPTQCYPDTQMCACKGNTSTTVRYDERLGFPREIVYEWRKQPNLTNIAYWRSLFDQSFPGCNRDGRGGPVVVNVTLIEEP
jgi:Family of unknown function (DUF6174)